MTTSSEQISSFADEFSVPRRNGEPVFDEPWQARSFGMVVSMCQSGLFPWHDFKARLIEEVERGSCKDGDSSTYYEQFFRAFWRLMAEKGFLTEEEMVARSTEYQSGARDDHRHDHDHDRDHGNAHAHEQSHEAKTPETFDGPRRTVKPHLH